MSVINVKSILTGKSYQFDTDKHAGTGAVKEVFFSPDRSYVVQKFIKPQDHNSLERLKMIVGKYRESIFNQAGGEYWESVYCWPTDIVTIPNTGQIALIAPTYGKEFFFQYGSQNNDMLGIKGRDKEGKWFASAHHQQRFIDKRERGEWRNYLGMCIKMSRAVKRLHAAGLAHSDLSYRNVLVDPVTGSAAVIDIDGLVVPQRFPPDVVGTPGFIAPEVLKTLSLPVTDKNKFLPCIETDRHALAVLIYMYVLYRHPLQGGKIHDPDPTRDEELLMGESALFIEHPSDKSNRPVVGNLRPTDLPYSDVTKLPSSIAGPYLNELFKKAFIDGLHQPNLRPSANDWETALVKTVDLIQPCTNLDCAQKWYVFDNSTKPACPFCRTKYKGLLPVLNLYFRRKQSDPFRPENHRLMVYKDQYLYPWHVSRHIAPNEKLTENQKKPVGYFVVHKGQWWFVNQTLSTLRDVTNKKDIPLGAKVALVEGLQLLLSAEDNGRLVQVQMVKGA
ncbi:MAG: helix-hairpin-helix domain-containing protein [Luteolibacter sp.]